MAKIYNSQLVRFLTSLDRFHYDADYSSEDAFELYHRIQEQDGALGSAAGGIGLPALGHALAGSAGTAISKLLLYPLDLAIARLQVQRQLRGPSETPSAASEADVEYRNLQDAVDKIYKNEGGIKAFYAGCLTDTSKSIVDAFLFFLAYTVLRQYRIRRLGATAGGLPILDELSVGIGAGAFAKFITTPAQNIVTRKQTAALVAARDPTSSLSASHSAQLSVKDIALQIRSERGIQGFWAGYSASLILTLNPALTFLLHNLFKRSLPASRREKPGPTLVFLLAALSKAAASAITYPFSLAKTRAQVSSSRSDSGSDASPSSAVDEKEHSHPPQDVSSSSGTAEKARSALYRVSRQTRRLLRLIFIQQLSQLAVLRSLQTVYRTEGLSGLYSGLEGEVLKGFLGHGLTMLLKERIHVLVIGAYYMLLNITKRLPTYSDLGEIRNKAGRELGRARGAAGEMASDAGERVRNVTETVAEGAKSAVAGAGVTVGEKK